MGGASEQDAATGQLQVAIHRRKCLGDRPSPVINHFSEILMLSLIFPKTSHASPSHRLNGWVLMCVLSGFGTQFTLAQQASVGAIARAEANRRAQQVNKAGDEIQRGYQLLDERKAEEALAIFSATYDSLPDVPLTLEHRLAARNGYVAAGCLHAQSLATRGNLEEARKLVEKLLSPEVAPKDPRVLALQKRLADPDRFPPALTEKHVGNVEAVQALLIKANSFIEIGDPDKAISTYQEILLIDPTNTSARRGMERAETERMRYFKAAYDHQRSNLLSKVDKGWEDPVPLNEKDVSAMFGAAAQTNAMIKSGSQSISEKLRTMMLPRVEFSGATMDEVVELLRVRSLDFDPQGRGINFVMSVPPEARGKPISLTLFNVPMEEVLRYVSEMCGVSYKVDEHAVTFVSLSERNSAIITRSFHVPPDFIQNAPAGPAAGAPVDPFAAQAPAAGGLTVRRMGAKEFLESRGVTFPEGTSANFNSATSMLTVRNTIQNMEMVELFVEQASKASPKLAVITVRMLEVNQTNLEELGFDWLMGGASMTGTVFGGGGTASSGNAFSAANYPFAAINRIPAVTANVGGTTAQIFPQQFVNAPLGGAVPVGVPSVVNGGGGGPLTSGLRSGTYATGNSSLDSLLQTGGAIGSQQLAPGVLSLAGVFTDPQFQGVMRGLSQKKGIDVSVSPSVTTKNGMKATVEVTREFIYPTEFDPPQISQNIGGYIPTPTTPTAFEMRKTGVQLEVEPVISEDGRTVELTISPSLTEFEGFVNYGTPIVSAASSTFQQIITLIGTAASTSYVPLVQPEQQVSSNIILQPIFKSQKVTTAVKIWDGATVVLGGLKDQRKTTVEDKLPILGDLPFVGRLFRSNTHKTDSKNIVIFVTVSVIDPSGQKINRDTAAVSR